ncbi:hypothetical protein BJ944DRAFT_133468 [Cunninghamella echinulata]|nr:hypothetical protein BJ944DRAFT_133468 [Cunninghamella echinulata]
MVDSLLKIDDKAYEANLLINNNNNNNNNKQSTTATSSVTDLIDHSYLPIGKALHLLLQVKSRVLITAIDTWKKKKDVSIQNNSPVIKALFSLDNYIKKTKDADTDIDSALQLIYSPLKEKILKSKKNGSQENIYQLLSGLLFYSDYKEQYQAMIKRELQRDDKRDNLAASLLFSFITKQIITPSPSSSLSFISNDSISTDIKYQLNILYLFIPDLFHILEQHSDTPTLLVCTTYDTLLSLTSIMIMSFFKEESKDDANYNRNDNKSNNTLITIIDDRNGLDEQHIKQMQDIWTCNIKLLSLAKKWQPSHDMITLCAWNELDIFIKTCQSILMDDSSKQEEYLHVAISWYWLSNNLQSTQLLSKKQKKVNSILHLKNKQLNEHISNYLKFLLLALLQKGEWLSLVDTEQKVENDDDSIERIRIICKSMIENYPINKPWQFINQLFLPFIYGFIPTFSTLCNVIPTAIILSICQFPWSDAIYQPPSPIKDHQAVPVSNIINCFVSNPQTSFSTLITWIEPTLTTTDNESSVFFYLEIMHGLLTYIITNWEEPSIICESLAYDLLRCVCHSNKCCEMIIQCMPFIHLTNLIRTLMNKLTQTKDERSNQVIKGLIAKALLVDHWSDDSVLLYIDLIRDYLQYPQDIPFEYKPNIMKSSSPKDLYSLMDTKKEMKKMKLSENEEMELLWPIQLWSSRANEKSLEKTISLLVEKFYDAPNESIFIRTWQMLTLAMINHEHLILIVLEKCTQLLESQNSLYNDQFYELIQDNAMIYVLLVPLLILRIFPEKVYNNVKLTSVVIEKWKDTWPIPIQQMKMTQNWDSTTGIYVRLANALLFRYNMTKNMTSLDRIHQLTKDVIYKLFQQQ